MYIRELKELIWGMPTVMLIFASGIYFSAKTGFFQITGIKKIYKNTVGSLGKNGKSGEVTPFMAVATALGGTVGVGSIAGVGYGIAAGGAGSIFWMWVSGFFGMMIKYSEIYIALGEREKTPDGYAGGAMYGLKKSGYGVLSVLFCVFCVAASFGVGNLAQTNSVAVILSGTGVPPLLTGTAAAVLLALIIFGGQKKIARISAFIVPAVSAVYLLCVFYILAVYIRYLPGAFVKIFREAFGFRAAAGGFSGVFISAAIRSGFTRGVFSNEAGMGSSPIAHAAAADANPAAQGMWGIVEIFIDTFVVSTATALVLICAGTDGINALFEYCFGPKGAFLLAALLSVFAFASIISWCFYSEGCIKFLSGKKTYLSFYRVLAVAAAFGGALISVNLIWDLADIFNALMIFPNMFLLFIKRNNIKRG